MHSPEEITADLHTIQQLHPWLDAARHIPKPRQLVTTHSTARHHTPTDLDLVALLDTRDRWHFHTPRPHIARNSQGILPTLDSWARSIAADLHDHHHPYPDLPNRQGPGDLQRIITWWLTPNLLTTTATLDDWPWLADDIRDLARRTLHHINRIPRLVDQTTPPPPTDPRLATIHPVTIAEAARLLQWPRSTIYDWAHKGRFICITHGTQTLYDLHNINATLAAHHLRRATLDSKPHKRAQNQTTDQ